MKVYLSGFMNPDDMEQSQAWRIKVRDALLAVGIEVVIPRAIYALSGGFDMKEGTSSAVVLSDLNDIDISDIVLVNLLYIRDKDRTSLATCMELFYGAHTKQMPVIVIAQGHQAAHPWVRYLATTIMDSVDAAIDHIINYWHGANGYERVK